MLAEVRITYSCALAPARDITDVTAASGSLCFELRTGEGPGYEYPVPNAANCVLRCQH